MPPKKYSVAVASSASPATFGSVKSASLIEELGVGGHIVDAMIRDLPAQRIPNTTKVFVRLEDVEALLEAGYLTDRQKAISYYAERHQKVAAA